MRRLVGVLLVLLPVSLFIAGCQQKAVKNPDKIMEPQQMKMPPDVAKKLGKTTPAPGIPDAKK
jgi:hypothetical protein